MAIIILRNQNILISAILMCALFKIETTFKIPHLFFPELAALSYGLFTNSHRNWLNDSRGVLFAPFLCSMIGVLSFIFLKNSAVSLFVAFVGGFLVLKVLNSSITPSISAGLFAIQFEISTFQYSLNILIISFLLILTGRILGKLNNHNSFLLAEAEPSKRLSRSEFIYVLLWFLIAILSSKYLNYREIILPPLFVILIETAKNATKLNLTQIFKVTGAVLIVSYMSILLKQGLGFNIYIIISVLVLTNLIIKMAKIDVPPLFALSLLPLILPTYTIFSPLITTVSLLFSLIGLTILCKKIRITN